MSVVPPVVFAVTVPLPPTTHVNVDTETAKTAGCASAKVGVPVHPVLSVIVIVYVWAESPVAVAVVPPYGAQE